MIRGSHIRTARAAGAAPAAPAGGAHLFWGRGCGYSVLAFTAWITLALPLAAAEPVPVPVPSGQPVALAEVLIDETPGEQWLRFRFIAPGIARDGGTVTYGQAGPDMDHLCSALALGYLQRHQLSPARIVISLSDRPLPFGAQDPAATQFFEVYQPVDGACIWGDF